MNEPLDAKSAEKQYIAPLAGRRPAGRVVSDVFAATPVERWSRSQQKSPDCLR